MKKLFKTTLKTRVKQRKTDPKLFLNLVASKHQQKSCSRRAGKHTTNLRISRNHKQSKGKYLIICRAIKGHMRRMTLYTALPLKQRVAIGT